MHDIAHKPFPFPPYLCIVISKGLNGIVVNVGDKAGKGVEHCITLLIKASKGFWTKGKL